ncbi:MAG: hypothetical protein JWO58_3366 [Chitinophagaceae bacterium]|nr:hypothetical protein [Chitinophagaceae bacterium]
MSFERSVFINCPFDPKYVELLRPILFCVLDLGFEPRIALERFDSAETRIEKIVELILACRYAIHDLSRLKSTRRNEISRLNMPFELGIDYGCRRFKGSPWDDKRILILERENFRYQAALSDLSGSDIASHKDDAATASKVVRNWLAQDLGSTTPGPTAIWSRFVDCMSDNFDALTARGYSTADIESQPVGELLVAMREWIVVHPL